MEMQAAIQRVTTRGDLNDAEMTAIMQRIMSGEATPAQIGGFLVGLAMKGETVTEIAAAARVMRELATQVEVDRDHLVDTCGTGGDARGTFNISTATAFVVAAAGGRVAKHGNRSVSSASGSADLLEAAGANLALSPAGVARCIDEAGVGFIFAPQHHQAMRHAIGPRREMGVRTLFNLLGPLTNPAGAPNQLLGVYADAWVRPIAEVLQALGSERVMVVHSEDGLDEISIAAPTRVAELRDGTVREYTIQPEDFGLNRAALEDLRVDSAERSLEIIQAIFDGLPGPATDLLALNAGAAITIAGLAEDLAGGVARAQSLLASGTVRETLAHFVATSQRLAEPS
ncbi:anthranilate phosphoribosyltransferase [Spiribacter salinus M19-40]|jgi:anthranilate phosphoribosyltransferase|uniref:Anthranilate phosphoribosyltransferase n=2 Tax=Spiribacter salinus TaxID=1335746 RepID=R4V5W5_9GAMM|nr:anthranilate phosphoribosyltransferase [Spiribacter salinus]AGM40450.1 anthranilate phosphoribosyltransferase [Spiribacter salinus M19-40]MDR9413324.1 anthranilate phosphoribosyltransferase [Spiribacter sp.]MDR9454421.1 anthranilate phosphoribosyltransferase [Spiribacter sp.]TQE99954.1 MAG: anthranilate phosphoribosyltransferase [Spiribacter salinus]